MIYVEVHAEKIPALGFGTWELRGDACERAVRHALEVGYRHIDTARMYGNEREVGHAIRTSGVERDEIFLATKIWPDDLHPDRVPQAVAASLEALGLEELDLLLIHWPSDSVPLEQTLDAMEAERDAGRVRHLGVSNFSPELFQRAREFTDILTNQVEYHPYRNQDDLVMAAQRYDLMLTAYSPLAKGRVLDDDTLVEIGEQHGKSAAQIALRWLLQQDNVAAIPRSSSPKHIESNFNVFDFELSRDELDRVSALADD